MKYLHNGRNLLSTAVLSAIGMLASSAVYRTGMARDGGGDVRLTGNYSGQHDATFDVEILDNDIDGVPQVSAPTFSGVGNGKMVDIAVDAGVDAQEITATLVGLGTETRRAYTPFQGVKLEARAAGASGNAITISVDDAAIVRTPTQVALLQSISRDSNELVGDEFDFGNAVLNPDGTIPTGAPRIAFGDDPQVYRAYKEYLDGRYVYSLSPAPVRDIQTGARVHEVTGTHTVTVTNGAHTDTYTNVTTLYSLLAQIEGDADGLVRVDGVVAIDLQPEGMAVNEMSVRTTSFLATLSRDGTQYARDADLGLTVAAAAPTETLTIRCSNADTAGAEQWDVSGTVSGQLPPAITGVAYDGDNYDFLIPVALPPALPPSLNESLARFNLLSRAEGEQLPSLCYRDLVAGAEAQSKTFTFVWARRPAAACLCDPSTIEGGPDDDILGVEVDPEGADVATIPEALRPRFKAVTAWLAAFTLRKTSLAPTDPNAPEDPNNYADETAEKVLFVDRTVNEDAERVAYLYARVSAVMRADTLDIKAAQNACSIMLKGLNRLHHDGEVADDPADTWDAAWTQLQADYDQLLDARGADWWRTMAYFGITGPVDGAVSGTDYEFAVDDWRIVITQAFAEFNQRYVAAINQALAEDNQTPDFLEAGLDGNDVWQDHGGPMWFESRDGLLPLQPGYYYHSARNGGDGEAGDGTGRIVPIPTREFGIGVQVGCIGKLKPGDELIITLDVAGNLRLTYQQGDTFIATIIRATDVPLGGGQTGDDTLTWRVVGSELGALDDYELVKTAPAPYDDEGVAFLINVGGIPYALGDVHRFRIEGGNARWRKNGGAWTDIAIAPSVAIADGLAAEFIGGAAPSYLPGDIFHFAAEATNGPDNVRTLRPGKLRASGTPARLVVDMGSAQAANGIYIGQHTLPGDASITLEASTTSDFAAIAFSHDVAPQSGVDIWSEFPTTPAYRYWRLTIDDGAWEIGYVWLGNTTSEMVAYGGARELGRVVRRQTLPSATARAGMGVRVEHEGITQASADELLAILRNAAANESGRVAIVCNGAQEPRANAIVRVDADSVEFTDLFDHQPEDPSIRWLSASLELSAAP